MRTAAHCQAAQVRDLRPAGRRSPKGHPQRVHRRARHWLASGYPSPTKSLRRHPGSAVHLRYSRSLEPSRLQYFDCRAQSPRQPRPERGSSCLAFRDLPEAPACSGRRRNAFPQSIAYSPDCRDLGCVGPRTSCLARQTRYQRSGDCPACRTLQTRAEGRHRSYRRD